MAKLKVRCGKNGCQQFKPCKTHGGWGKSARELPKNWRQLSRIIRSRKFCAKFSECGNLGTDVDHIICRKWGGSDDLSNLQLLCKPCHQKKTKEESNWGHKRDIPDFDWWTRRWT